MGYNKNPFNSANGMDIVEKIFDLMFIPEEHNPNKIEKENKQRQVLFYRGNIINIVWIFFQEKSEANLLKN